MLLATMGCGHAAETFPARPVRIVVAAAPGGLVDLAARVVGQKMGEKLGQPVVVENRAGGDTLLGIRYVKSAPADGYTLLATSDSIASQPAVKLEPGYDLLKDFTGIGPLVRTPWFMLVGPSQPDKTVVEFIARGKTHPETMSFASGGLGTTPYLAAAKFLQQADLKLLHVPYKGNGAAIMDVMSGRITMLFDSVTSSASKVRAGQLRALGVSSPTRLPAFPGIPTIAEQGLTNFSSQVYIGLLAPAGTPKDVVARLSSALRGATSSKEVREPFEAENVEVMSATPEAFNDMLKQDLARMSELATALGLKKQ